MFPGYHLRDKYDSYTTPELAGAVLDAIEAVRRQFPGTCDVFIGDFSKKGGGPLLHHSSHQNGRDVDIGMYAKHNRPLDGLVPMNKHNLDPAKTLCLIQNLVASQRVQYIFLDKRIQKILYEYGISHGYKQAYMNRLFGNVPGALVQDIPGHYTHMHVRFFTPWSTLAAHIGHDEPGRRAIIQMAQESYLPKKVEYYVTGYEKGLRQLARNFGVTEAELCRWNHISPLSVLVPGSCLVFYKRSFESGPVLLARSLEPGYIAQVANPPVRMASLQSESEPLTVSDSTFADDAAAAESGPPEDTVKPVSPSRAHKAGKEATLRTSTSRKSGPSAIAYYTVRHGGTLRDVAKKTGIPLSLLCRLNGMDRDAPLKAGRRIKLAPAKLKLALAARKRGASSSSICFESEKAGSVTAAYYRVIHGGRLSDVARKTGIPLSSLCRLNGLRRDARLRRGQMIKLAQANLPIRPSFGKDSCSLKYSPGKSTALKHKKSVKKSLRYSEAKAARKTSARSRASKHTALAGKHARTLHNKRGGGKAALHDAHRSGKLARRTLHKRAAIARIKTAANSRGKKRLAKK